MTEQVDVEVARAPDESKNKLVVKVPGAAAVWRRLWPGSRSARRTPAGGLWRSDARDGVPAADDLAVLAGGIDLRSSRRDDGQAAVLLAQYVHGRLSARGRALDLGARAGFPSSARRGRSSKSGLV